MQTDASITAHASEANANGGSTPPPIDFQAWHGWIMAAGMLVVALLTQLKRIKHAWQEFCSGGKALPAVAGGSSSESADPSSEALKPTDPLASDEDVRTSADGGASSADADGRTIDLVSLGRAVHCCAEAIRAFAISELIQVLASSNYAGLPTITKNVAKFEKGDAKRSSRLLLGRKRLEAACRHLATAIGAFAGTEVIVAIHLRPNNGHKFATVARSPGLRGNHRARIFKNEESVIWHLLQNHVKTRSSKFAVVRDVTLLERLVPEGERFRRRADLYGYGTVLGVPIRFPVVDVEGQPPKRVLIGMLTLDAPIPYSLDSLIVARTGEVTGPLGEGYDHAAILEHAFAVADSVAVVAASCSVGEIDSTLLPTG